MHLLNMIYNEELPGGLGDFGTEPSGRQRHGGHGDCYDVAVVTPTATTSRWLATWQSGRLQDRA